MFGRQYAEHLDLLMHSYGQMNKDYLRKAHEKKRIAFIEKLKKLYVFLFGIPEIGFQLRSIYFKNILSSYVELEKPKMILDAGSGIGAYTFWLARRFPRALVTGGDIDRHKIKSCRALAREFHVKNVSFDYLNITKVQEKSAFDFIVTIDVLEHLEDYTTALKNFHRLLRKDGLLYIHVPQPHQKRILYSLREWHHEDHVREGIGRKMLEFKLKKLGFNILVSRETFGFFGKLAWELNHITLTKNFILAGLLFPALYILALIDERLENTHGLCMAVLAQKRLLTGKHVKFPRSW